MTPALPLRIMGQGSNQGACHSSFTPAFEFGFSLVRFGLSRTFYGAFRGALFRRRGGSFPGIPFVPIGGLGRRQLSRRLQRGHHSQWKNRPNLRPGHPDRRALRQPLGPAGLALASRRPPLCLRGERQEPAPALDQPGGGLVVADGLRPALAERLTPFGLPSGGAGSPYFVFQRPARIGKLRWERLSRLSRRPAAAHPCASGKGSAARFVVRSRCR